MRLHNIYIDIEFDKAFCESISINRFHSLIGVINITISLIKKQYIII